MSGPSMLGNAGDGFQVRPDGRGGIRYVRPGNVKLREIPARERILEVHCHTAGRHDPRVVAVLTADWRLHVIAGAPGGPAGQATPVALYTQCRCGPHGHMLDLEKVRRVAADLAHRPRKGRTVDVRRVAVDGEDLRP